MQNFLVLSNRNKPEGPEYATLIEAYLKSHGCRCEVYPQDHTKAAVGSEPDLSMVPDGIQCIIVLGGDGTLLRTARAVVRQGLPLIGINLGHLGFLAEVDRKSLYPALDRLIRDDFEIEQRMMLEGILYRKGHEIGRDIALNDIVISRDGNLRVIRFQNYVNHEALNAYDADGVIISTPTGSTGYSLSAGGPIVSPNARLMIMTPVAPHVLNTRSIIFPAEDTLTVEIGPGRHTLCERAAVSFDGDVQLPMQTADRIEIRQAKAGTKIIKLSHLSFLETLRYKMKDG